MNINTDQHNHTDEKIRMEDENPTDELTINKSTSRQSPTT